MSVRVLTTQNGAESETASRNVVKSGTRARLLPGRQALLSTTKPLIQPKLKIGEPNDKYEQEADRVADQVMRIPAAQVAGSCSQVSGTAQGKSIQRLCTKCRADRDKEVFIQARSFSGPAVKAGSSIADGIQSLQGGQPLRDSSRNFFEARFGYDFSQVRIHTDRHAAGLARGINARAFTLGSDVVFASSQYSPDSDTGRHLIAHELTHVIQQSSASKTTGSSPRIQRLGEDDEPTMGFTCGLLEMSLDSFDDSRSCCAENILQSLDGMLQQSIDAIRVAIERMSSGAAIDGLLRQHFGDSGPAQRDAILNKIRNTLTVAENFRDNHTFLCRPLSSEFGCTGEELARAGEDSDITVCMGAGSPMFDWETILHELFHASGEAMLPTFGENATPQQVERGEFETYFHPQGTESDDPRFQRYPSAEPLRNADSYAHLISSLSASDWAPEGNAARFIPALSLGAGVMLGGGNVEPVAAARLAFTPLGRGLHFITPGAVGLWMPGLGTVDATDPDAEQPRAYVGGEIGLRAVTGSGPVAGVFDLGAGIGSVFRRSETASVGSLVRGSAGLRFGTESAGASINLDLMRMFDFALQQQRPDGWIIGLSLQGHWGGHSGAPR